MIDYRPCGECGALVPATGCEHWRPRDLKIGETPVKRNMDAKREADRIRQKERRARQREELAASRRMMTRKVRT